MKDFSKNAFSGLARKIGIVSLMAICLALFSASANAQTVLVNYDFASAVAGTPCTASPLTTASGVTSTFTTGGTGGGTCTTPAGTAATAPPAFVANAANQSVSLTSFLAGSSNFFQFQLSGVSSFENYMLFFQAQRSGTGPVNADVQYSTNGTTFTTFQTINPGNGVFAAFNIDLSSIPAIEGQPTVYFRIVGSGGTGAAGTFRIDNFQVQASTIVVAPTTDLTISQSAPASVVAGSSFVYTLTVNNSGSTALTNVDVNFTLPTGVTYNAAGGTCTSITLVGNVVQFRGCSVGAATNATLTVNVTAPGTAQTLVNPGTNVVVDPTVSVAESNEGNNTAADFTTNVTAAPTAAMVNVGGRVTDAKGRGISGATVMMVDSNGNNLSAVTDDSGNYLFEGVEVGQTLIINVRAKRYNFAQPSQVVSLTEETLTVNFKGSETKRFGL
jgi:hypothetical protein